MDGRHDTVCIIGILLIVTTITSNGATDFCHSLASKTCHMKTSSPVFVLCPDPRVIEGPCCYDESNKSISGLDVGGCNVTDFTHYLDELADLQYLSLTGSPVNCSSSNFHGLTKLKVVWMSESCQEICPGGNASWYEHNKEVCENQTDTCQIKQVTCPANSECVLFGPGQCKCNCKPPYHGYKCLDDGEFPLAVFLVSLSSATIITSVILWFFTLRKTISTVST